METENAVVPEQSFPGLRWRIIVTIILSLIRFVAGSIYSAFQGPVEGAYAVNQLKDNVTEYSLGRAMANGLPTTFMNWTLLIALALIWLTYLLRGKKRGGSSAAVAVLILFAVGWSGCVGPGKIEQFVQIGPNETAYVIPLEGASRSGQAKFDSVDFLEAKKVAAKRISLNLREKSTGRGWWNYEWIPTDMVIKVDRAPVTREWTSSPDTGTAKADQSLHMQSSDSIPFHIGATITVSITEEDSSLYLYNYGLKPLADVVDHNIRSFILGELTTAFAGDELAKGQKDKAEFFAKAGNDAKVYFKKKGISVDYFGIEGGLGYDNVAVQRSLDQKYIAENDKAVATNEQAAQVIRNATAIAKATADAKAASMFAANIGSLTAKTDNEIKTTLAEAKKIAAQKWDGHLPASVVPESGAFIFDLKPTSSK